MAEVMQTLKKQWVSVMCGIIALVALVLTWVWVGAQRNELQSQLDKRKATYDSLMALQSKPRHLPIVNPTAPDATPPELGRFPGPRVIEAGVAAMTQVQQQSVGIESRAVQMNEHKLLVPGSLPIPQDAFRFRREYQRALQVDIPKALNSVTPPTEDEIKAEAERQDAIIEKAAPRDEQTGKIYNPEAVDQQKHAMEASLPEKMRQEAANKHKIYLAPGALAIHPDLEGDQEAPDPEKIWYAQMGLWCQQDVVASINVLNRNSQNIPTSPVKQIVAITLAPDRTLYVIPTNSAAGAAAAPAQGAAPASPVAANTDTDPLPKDYSVSPTGRVCNGVFDVVHFTVVLNIQVPDIDRVIAELERGKFLTVYQTEVTAMNSIEASHEGYNFGKMPVATVTLLCEEVFMRDWTRKWMPKAVKDYLNVQDLNPAAPAAQPTASIN